MLSTAVQGRSPLWSPFPFLLCPEVPVNIIASLPFEGFKGYQDEEIQKNRRVSVVFGRGSTEDSGLERRYSLTVHEKNNLIT